MHPSSTWFWSPAVKDLLLNSLLTLCPSLTLDNNTSHSLKKFLASPHFEIVESVSAYISWHPLIRILRMKSLSVLRAEKKGLFFSQNNVDVCSFQVLWLHLATGILRPASSLFLINSTNLMARSLGFILQFVFIRSFPSVNFLKSFLD